MVSGWRTTRRTLCLSNTFWFLPSANAAWVPAWLWLKTGTVKLDRQSPPLMSLDSRSSEWEGAGFLRETYIWWTVHLEVEEGPMVGYHCAFSPTRQWDPERMSWFKKPGEPGVVVQACDPSTFRKVEAAISESKASFSHGRLCLKKIQTKPSHLVFVTNPFN